MAKLYTLRDLYNKNDKKFNARAKLSKITTIKFLKTKKAFQFRVVTDLSKGIGRSLVSIKPLDDKLVDHINTRWKGKLFGDLPCLVHCNCKAYNYWGPAYNATKRGYELGRAQNIPAPVRDPKGKIWICKHIARVFLDYRRKALWELAVQAGIKIPKAKSNSKINKKKIK